MKVTPLGWALQNLIHRCHQATLPEQYCRVQLAHNFSTKLSPIWILCELRTYEWNQDVIIASCDRTNNWLSLVWSEDSLCCVCHGVGWCTVVINNRAPSPVMLCVIVEFHPRVTVFFGVPYSLSSTTVSHQGDLEDECLYDNSVLFYYFLYSLPVSKFSI